MLLSAHLRFGTYLADNTGVVLTDYCGFIRRDNACIVRNTLTFRGGQLIPSYFDYHMVLSS